MFGKILISVFTLMHIYVFWRAASVPLVERGVSRKCLIGAGVALWAIFFFGRVVGHGGTGVMAWTLELLGMNWMAVLFLTFVPLLGIDLVTAFGFLMPRLAPSLRGWALVAGGVLSLIALFQGLRPPVVQRYEASLSGLPGEMDGTVVVALSDLHLGSLLGERWLVDRVAQVQAQRPDLVVLLGDILEGHGQPQDNLLLTLRRLSAPLGVWAVPGNHELHGRRDTSMSLIENAGFQVLRNRWAEVRPGLVLAGVEDLTARRRTGQGGDPISQALAGRPPGATVLLSHTPWQAERVAKAGVGLMLCGHTHGGQIWPLDYLIRLAYPLLEGRYEVDGTTVIVCRGTGTWGPRMRLWRPSEILRVTLSGKEKRDMTR
ncbi:MAG: metallophosphoesterase [Deltaproteobacteria bacterium]|nr:MAG: metallophosphoesterase [Deltaproteobacteria bacterium]